MPSSKVTNATTTIRDSIVPSTDLDYLLQEIECIICLNTVRDSRMCIHCSAIVCSKCIEDWLNKQMICPKCSHSVQKTISFVHCRLTNKVIDFVEMSKRNQCSDHPTETLRIHCSTCNKRICFACILFDGQHNNHEYVRIEDSSTHNIALIQEHINTIRQRYKRVQEKFLAIEPAIEKLFVDHSVQMVNLQGDDQRTERLATETQRRFDSYRRQKRMLTDEIKIDELFLADIEQRFQASMIRKNPLDHQDILRLIQQHISSSRNTDSSMSEDF